MMEYVADWHLASRVVDGVAPDAASGRVERVRALLGPSGFDILPGLLDLSEGYGGT